MKVVLVVLAVCGLSTAAPQNWPYRDSLMPYRYGYPAPGTQYKYLPQIEDDEDSGPYLTHGMGRQDVVVGSDGDRIKVTTESTGVGVVETGSVAPVVEPTKAPPPPPTTRAPPPPPKPVGPEGGNRPVLPPVFPPARPPPTPAPVVADEEEEDDESDEEADDEDENEEFNPAPDDDDENNDEEEEEEEERRRQVPLNSDETVEVPNPPAPISVPEKPKHVVVQQAPKPKPAIVKPVEKPRPVVVETSVEEVNATQVIESNEVGRPDSDDESSEEQGLGDGVEALVPGYVTDQGEVLVPVDTVTGDQPISIVPDPYTPVARGVSLRGSQTYRQPYEPIEYEDPYYYPEDIYDGLGRQENSVSEEVTVPKTSGSKTARPKKNKKGDGRNEYLTAFPPARTPELYALLQNRFQALDSSEEFPLPYSKYVYQQVREVYRPGPYQGPYNQQRRQGGYVPLRYQSQNPYSFSQYQGPYNYVRQPVIYRRPQTSSNPSVSLNVRVQGFGNNNIPNNYRNPYVNRYVGQNVVPGLRGPYSPAPVYRPRPVLNPGVYGGGVPVSNGFSVRPRPYYRPTPFPIFDYPRPFGVGPVPPSYTQKQRPRPIFQGTYAFGGPKPFVIKRRPISAAVQPVSLRNKEQIPVNPSYTQIGPKYVANKNREPTPVVLQDDEQYPYEDSPPPGFYQSSPETDLSYDSISYGPNESSSVETNHNSNIKKLVTKVTHNQRTSPAAKSRRAAKMTEKLSKKGMEKKRKTADPDPLNILKKVSMKKS